jgi:predicted GNAT family N-acyltransferase
MFAYIKLENPAGLAVVDAMRVIEAYKDQGSAYLITRVNVPERHRQSGVGTALMQQAIDRADKEKKVLLLDPHPSASGMSRTKLREWYSRFGFVSIGGVMWRLPR